MLSEGSVQMEAAHRMWVKLDRSILILYLSGMGEDKCSAERGGGKKESAVVVGARKTRKEDATQRCGSFTTTKLTASLSPVTSCGLILKSVASLRNKRTLATGFYWT